MTSQEKSTAPRQSETNPHMSIASQAFKGCLGFGALGTLPVLAAPFIKNAATAQIALAAVGLCFVGAVYKFVVGCYEGDRARYFDNKYSPVEKVSGQVASVTHGASPKTPSKASVRSNPSGPSPVG